MNDLRSCSACVSKYLVYPIDMLSGASSLARSVIHFFFATFHSSINSFITRSPRLSHISSRLSECGLWAVRMALQPMERSFRRRRNRASSYAATPIHPKSWCMFTPFIFTDFPFRRKPSSASNLMLRIPNFVVFLSITYPSEAIRVV